MVNKQDIIGGLRKLGLVSGDTVVVHSSLSCFGKVKDGAKAVVDALLEVIGSKGTLIVPTFNFNPGVFDPEETPSIVGAITEELRKRPDALRSKHPTHSVAAIGALADVITEGHEKTDAFGRSSALFNALQVRAKILQLGTDQTSNSMIHVAEEIAKVPYLERSRQVKIKSPSGKIVQIWVRRPGCSRGFGAVEEVLQDQDAINETFIGDCTARLMSARDVVDAAVDLLKTDPEALLCNLPDCESCAEARAMIAATEADRQENEIKELAEEEERTRLNIEKRFDGGQVTYFDTDDFDISLN